MAGRRRARGFTVRAVPKGRRTPSGGRREAYKSPETRFGGAGVSFVLFRGKRAKVPGGEETPVPAIRMPVAPDSRNGGGTTGKNERQKKLLMAVKYYNDGCSYRLPEKRRTAAWLRETAGREGYVLGDVNYIFCSAERLLEMNRQYLGHDYYTDVITFDYSDRRGTRTVAGDIFIDVETVADNARIYGAPRLQEMRRVVVHGLLHLCGQNDKTPRTNAQMHRKEDRYLALLEKEF